MVNRTEEDGVNFEALPESGGVLVHGKPVSAELSSTFCRLLDLEILLCSIIFFTRCMLNDKFFGRSYRAISTRSACEPASIHQWESPLVKVIRCVVERKWSANVDQKLLRPELESVRLVSKCTVCTQTMFNFRKYQTTSYYTMITCNRYHHDGDGRFPVPTVLVPSRAHSIPPSHVGEIGVVHYSKLYL